MSAHLDLHFLVQAPQKIEQLVRGKAAEMPVHQVRYIGLCNPENPGDLALFYFLIFQNLENVNPNLRPGIELSGILQPQLGKEIAGILLKLNYSSFFRAHAPGTSPFVNLKWVV